MTRPTITAVMILGLFTGVAGQAMAQPIPVANAGFENPVLEDFTDTDDSLPGWVGSGGTLIKGANFGAFNPPTTYFPGEAPEGNNVAFIQDGQISQLLTATLQPGTYQLSVLVGQSLVDDDPSPFSVKLLAGGSVLGQANSPIAALGSFAEVTVTYTALTTDPLIGQQLEIVLVDAGVPGRFQDEPYFDRVALDFTELSCPCDLFTTSDFGPPMGKKKKLASILPLKFNLFFDGIEIQGQDELDLVLELNGCLAACPEIDLFDVTDAAEALEIELPDDSTNVGGGGDLGFCFRFSDGNWIYNLDLDPAVFEARHTYMVEVVIGDCSLVLGNDLFQTK